MVEFLPRLFAHLVMVERQRGGFLVMPTDLPAALDAVGQDGSKWLTFMMTLEQDGYFAQAQPATTAKRVLTAKALDVATRA